MKKALKITIVLIVSLAFTILTGCAAKTVRVPVGFLTDYSKLTKDSFDALDSGYEKTGADWETYDKIIIEKVVFFLDENAEYKGIDPEDFTEMAKYYYNSMVTVFGDFYTLTDKAGEGTLRLRIAITDLVQTKPVRSVWSSFMPPALIISHVKKATTGSHTGMGSVSFELEVIDSQTNEVIGAAIFKNQGKKYKVHKSFTKWGQVEDIFNDFAKLTRTQLDKRIKR
jgi:hypothetical protein